MRIVRAALSAVVLVASGALALAAGNSITATVKSWDPAAKVLVLDDDTRYQVDPAIVPPDLKPGETVTLNWAGSEGIDKVTKVERAN